MRISGICHRRVRLGWFVHAWIGRRFGIDHITTRTRSISILCIAVQVISHFVHIAIVIWKWKTIFIFIIFSMHNMKWKNLIRIVALHCHKFAIESNNDFVMKFSLFLCHKWIGNNEIVMLCENWNSHHELNRAQHYFAARTWNSMTWSAVGTAVAFRQPKIRRHSMQRMHNRFFLLHTKINAISTTILLFCEYKSQFENWHRIQWKDAHIHRYATHILFRFSFCRSPSR